MSAKKLPYVPIYIGDWEQDTNSISLEAEGALLKLTFKCWKAKPDKGVFVTTWQALSILLKKSEPETRKIVGELRDNNIFDFEDFEQSVIKIISRRMYRETQLSRVRSDAAKGIGQEQDSNKSLSKHQQKEIAFDIEIDNEVEDVNLRMKLREWVVFRKEEQTKHKALTLRALKANIEFLSDYSAEEACKIIKQSMDCDWQGLFPLKQNYATAGRQQQQQTSRGKINDGYSEIERQLREGRGDARK
jgi:uncharacterized protein YdaU (DUF1376 family)